VHAYSKIVAVSDALIQSQKRVPGLVRIPYDSKALASEPPVKGID